MAEVEHCLRSSHADAKRWLRWLDPVDAEIVLARISGACWKSICWQFGCGRATGHRRWTHALFLIACRLNGRSISATISQRALARIRHHACGTSARHITSSHRGIQDPGGLE
ncbi:MAG: DUF6362 family protein [Bauldia sp.]